MPAPIPFQANNIVVGTSLTKLIEIPLAGLDKDVSFELQNAAGSSTTNNFVITRRLHDNGAWLNYLGGVDFANATSKCTASTPGPAIVNGATHVNDALAIVLSDITKLRREDFAEGDLAGGAGQSVAAGRSAMSGRTAPT